MHGTAIMIHTWSNWQSNENNLTFRHHHQSSLLSPLIKFDSDNRPYEECIYFLNSHSLMILVVFVYVLCVNLGRSFHIGLFVWISYVRVVNLSKNKCCICKEFVSIHCWNGMVKHAPVASMFHMNIDNCVMHQYRMHEYLKRLTCKWI